MPELNEKIVQILEDNDYRICGDINEQDGEYVAEIETYSPEGEDVIVTVFFDGTTEDFIVKFREYADDFDADEHAENLIMIRGTNGVPSSIRTLLDDANAIKKSLDDMATKLEVVQEHKESVKSKENISDELYSDFSIKRGESTFYLTRTELANASAEYEFITAKERLRSCCMDLNDIPDNILNDATHEYLKNFRDYGCSDEYAMDEAERIIRKQCN